MNDLNTEITAEAIASRLKAVVHGFAGSSARVAQLSGIPKRTLDGYLAGETSIPAERLATICDVTGQDVAKILYGTGAVRHLSFGSASTLIDDSLGGRYAVNDHERLVHIPLYSSKLSAGEGEFVETDEVVGTRAFDRDWLENTLRIPASAAALAVVRGDSMWETLADTDLTLMDRRDTGPDADDIYALRVDGDLLVKRLQRGRDGIIEVHSDNKKYKSWSVTRDSSNQTELRILGRVRWWAHSN